MQPWCLAPWHLVFATPHVVSIEPSKGLLWIRAFVSAANLLKRASSRHSKLCVERLTTLLICRRILMDSCELSRSLSRLLLAPLSAKHQASSWNEDHSLMFWQALSTSLPYVQLLSSFATPSASSATYVWCLYHRIHSWFDRNRLLMTSYDFHSATSQTKTRALQFWPQRLVFWISRDLRATVFCTVWSVYHSFVKVSHYCSSQCPLLN